MHYLIDNDLLEVESCHEDSELLAAYIVDNGLDLALTLVGEPDDLVMELTLKELNTLYTNLSGRDMKFEEEDGAASAIMTHLKKNSDDYPVFTKSLGKKMLKKGEQDKPEATSKAVKPKAAKATGENKKPTQRASKPRIKLDYSQEITIVNGKSKEGSILSTIVTAVEDEMCVTVGEVVEYITTNHVRGKSGEMANESYAVTSIRDLAKMGKISLEEGL
ncbi:MAG: hypothetical protein GOVbin8609_3 [Prokaryotic dsDNA virus sp.]|nr:MAG: hypothetical protein GOVbin8609_3 [Prokaryotic dsDNA virus sp.]|tara:strand:- start:7790 stop:8446 length:657 start_codon:yes stop_codon:yes gene_type:complete